MIVSDRWKDYELIDASCGERLERWGKYLLVRPDPQVVFGGERRIALARELTKLHEEIIRTTIDGALEYYSERPPRGEYVIVVEGASEAADEEESPFWSDMSITEHVDKYISEGMSQKDAIKKAATDRNVPKREVYNEYHK